MFLQKMLVHMSPNSSGTYERSSLAFIAIALICSILLIYVIARNRATYKDTYLKLVNIDCNNTFGSIVSGVSFALVLDDGADDINDFLFLFYVDFGVKCNFLFLATLLIVKPKCFDCMTVFVCNSFFSFVSVCISYTVLLYAPHFNVMWHYYLIGIVYLIALLCKYEKAYYGGQEHRDDRTRLRLNLCRLYVGNMTLTWIGFEVYNFFGFPYLIITGYMSSFYTLVYLNLTNSTFRTCFKNTFTHCSIEVAEDEAI